VADVFISYKREDRPFAEKLASALSAYDLSVWWDHELAAGDAFRAVIQRELDSAKAVVVLWSHGSTQSAFVLDEAGRGLARGALVPVAIDDAPAPLGFGQAHTLDLRAWNGDAADAEVRAIAAACARGSGSDRAAKPKGARFGRLSFWPSAGFAAIVGATGGAVIGYEELAQGQPMGAPGAFWAVHLLAGIAMIGAAGLAARWIFAAAQRLAGGRARGFFDPPFAALCAVSLALGAVSELTIKDKSALQVLVLMSAMACLGLSVLALPLGWVFGRVRRDHPA
jgi:hypothetical protein